MSRVTKSVAKEISKIMVSKAMDEIIQKKSNEIRSIVQKYADDTVPFPISKLYNDPQYKGFFNTQSNFSIRHGVLHEFESIYIFTSIPFKGLNFLDISKDHYDRIGLLNIELKELRSNKSKLLSKMEATLLSLKTYKNIEKEFPEAYSCIPADYKCTNTVTTVALPIQDLKLELLKYKKS